MLLSRCALFFMIVATLATSCVGIASSRQVLFLDEPMFEQWARAFCVSYPPTLEFIGVEPIEKRFIGYAEIIEPGALVRDSWELVPDYAFDLIEQNGDWRVEYPRTESFVDLCDFETSRVYRIANVGSAGLIHNAFWLENGQFLVVGIDDGWGLVILGDLSTMKIQKYRIDKKSIKFSKNPDRYVIRSHGR